MCQRKVSLMTRGKEQEPATKLQALVTITLWRLLEPARSASYRKPETRGFFPDGMTHATDSTMLKEMSKKE